MTSSVVFVLNAERGWEEEIFCTCIVVLKSGAFLRREDASDVFQVKYLLGIMLLGNSGTAGGWGGRPPSFCGMQACDGLPDLALRTGLGRALAFGSGSLPRARQTGGLGCTCRVSWGWGGRSFGN